MALFIEYRPFKMVKYFSEYATAIISDDIGLK